MARTKFLGYQPDADSTTRGVIVDCQSAVPSINGMEGAPSAVTGILAALAAEARGAAVIRKLDNTTRFFAGTSTKIYEAATTTWEDRVTCSALPTNARWSFAQFGNVSLAVQKNDLLQFSASTTFADVTSTPQAVPKASIVETVGQFVFLFDTDEATYGDSPDRWWCSASGNYADWNPSVTTECATGRLIGSPGPIKAAKRFGDQIVVYKANSMYLGTYQGAPEVWRFDEVPGDIGAISQDAVHDIGTTGYPRHIFMGMDDFYIYDGSRPIPIGSGVIKHEVFNSLSYVNARLCISLHDIIHSRIYFFYPTESTLTKCVVYNYLTKQWGRDDRAIECCADFISAGITYAGLGTYYSTYADLPNIDYDSAFLSANTVKPAIFNTSHVLQTLTGVTGNSYITTGDMGEEEAYTLVTHVRPLFLEKPTTTTLTNFYRENLGDALTTDNTNIYDDGKYDVFRSARWHRFKFAMNGDWEAANFNVYAKQEGVS